MDCLFCSIIRGDIPSKKVYEDDSMLVFEDIDPKAPVHVLAVPKKHITSLNEINDDNIIYISEIMKKIPVICEKLGIKEKGYRVVNNIGESGGQTVNHIHFHILGGRNLQWPPG